MAVIALNGKHGAGKYAIVDDCDFDRLSKYKWHVTSEGYVARHLHSGGIDTLLLMHRDVMQAQPGVLVDHEKGNKLDNRRCKLRICDQPQNSWNARRVTGKSKYKGVWLESKKWRAAITKRGKRIHLGRYKTEQEAAMAYDFAAKELYGEFAATNFND
jgi:hypothetical protein